MVFESFTPRRCLGTEDDGGISLPERHKKINVMFIGAQFINLGMPVGGVDR